MRILLALTLLMMLSGCAKVVDDFVTGGDPAITPPTIGSTDDDGAFKMTPGSVRSTGSSISMKAVITTNRHVSTGNNVSAIMGLHKSR